MSDERVEIDVRKPLEEQMPPLTEWEREQMRMVDEFWAAWDSYKRDQEVRRRFARMPYHPLRHVVLEMEGE